MVWFVMIPPTARRLSDAQKELVDFRVEYTDPRAIAAVEAGQIINGKNFGNKGNPQLGLDLVKWKGPFVTEAQAQAAQAPRQQSANPAADAANAAATAVGPLAGIAGSLEAIFGAVTDGKMWRSLGWIILGIMLMYLGVALWLGPSAARRSPLGVLRSVGTQVA